MKVAVASDLHLEFKDIDIQNTENADVLILAGDILVTEDLHQHPEMNYGMYTLNSVLDLGHRQQMAVRYREFFKRVSDAFPHVIYIAGNHEFYQGNWKSTIEYLREECAKFPNIYFLENDIKEIDDVVFAGATLWTDCNKGDPLTLHALTDMMNDFKVIRNDELGYTKLRPAHIMHRHQQTLSYFKNVIDDRKDKKIVVVGHHSPSHQSIHTDYARDTLMNGGYHSNLDEFILDRPQIKLWVHGHTHYPFDYNIGDTRILCNPRGYGGWDPYADMFQTVFLDV
jgi:predicted phosphodiesterase